MAGNRSGSWQKLKAGVKKDGTIVALQAVSIVSAVSARVHRPDNRISIAWATRIAKSTHCTQTKIHRWRCARPVIRRHPLRSNLSMDELAHKIKMDPVEFRIKNLRDEVYHRQLDRGAKEIGWARRNPFAGGNRRPIETRHGLCRWHLGRRRQ